ncbi:TIGR03087 family PEP-CTERM/XrtA system glycosyltransferase [Sphingomonas sp. CARO-RG-8B-R24-01]|uniref:TIGR03087 family PEP-CTERM/XrtA system glycosyltransferase n=1 Tax=Sphingomonas sp. CARO-RG-8B-R24-01 TaxID=2914831 RepID=UPI001F57DDA9|nr:TIGR03087 family PEP-CTERM/XrtA system glycosyltransferase [Sphingomonas sp. CARO-RG-8B-R24-01]
MGDILFLGHRLPYPPNRGDKIRGYHVLRHLAATQRVHLIAFADDPRDLEPWDAIDQITASRTIVWRSKSRLRAAAEAIVSGAPISLTAFADRAVRSAVETLLAEQAIDTIYVFSSQMAQYLPLNAGQRVIMDFVDMDAAKFEAYARDSRGPMRWLMAREAALLLRHDTAIARRSQANLFVSAAEATLFRERSGAANVHAVENGIDTAFFNPERPYAAVDLPGPSIVFTGQMDYRPNVEAVTWFVDAILPKIRRIHPDARFAIVGRASTEAVRKLALHPGVTVTGEVADVRAWIAAASVVVAPLKLARGVQNKVLEAMAMARPVVASRAAAEGIDHRGTIRVGETADALGDAITAILRDPAAAAHLGQAARTQVMTRYSWAARLAPLDGFLGHAAAYPVTP